MNVLSLVGNEMAGVHVLQVLEGVAALHSVSLIHCDIKLDNVFITQNPAFAPFRVCAKVGDLDTCRSLLGAHLTNDSFGRIESMKAASDTESSGESRLSTSSWDTNVFS